MHDVQRSKAKSKVAAICASRSAMSVANRAGIIQLVYNEEQHSYSFVLGCCRSVMIVRQDMEKVDTEARRHRS